MQRQRAKQFRLGADAQTANVPATVVALVSIDCRVFVLKSPTEKQTLHDGILIVLVPLGEFPDLLVEVVIRRCLVWRLRLSLPGRQQQCQQQWKN